MLPQYNRLVFVLSTVKKNYGIKIQQKKKKKKKKKKIIKNLKTAKIKFFIEKSTTKSVFHLMLKAQLVEYYKVSVSNRIFLALNAINMHCKHVQE